VKEKIEFSTCSDNRMNELDTITDINTNVYNSNRSKGHDIFIFPVIEKEELFYSYFLNLVEKNEELTSLKPVESLMDKTILETSENFERIIDGEHSPEPMTLGLLKKDIKLFVQCKYKKMRGYKE
jgi:hypothetical protein